MSSMIHKLHHFPSVAEQQNGDFTGTVCLTILAMTMQVPGSEKVAKTIFFDENLKYI